MSWITRVRSSVQHSDRSMAEDVDEEESWGEDEQEEENLDVSAEDEEEMDEDVLEDDEDVATDDYEEESVEEYEDEDSDNYWGQSPYDDPHKDKTYSEYDSGLTSEEERLIAESDEDIHSRNSDSEQEIAKMQAADEQYGEGMDPGRWRKMSKRQRKKWRRKQRRAA